MSSKKQKEKKKKNREKRVEQKIFVRREALRKERKTLELQRRQEEEAQDLVHGKLKPIVNDHSRFEEVKSKKERVALDQLEKNLKILEALEEEYDKESKMRENINEVLESEGHLTMAEKMDALHKKALEMAESKMPISDNNEQNLAQEENL
jgi:hypothetical protein